MKNLIIKAVAGAGILFTGVAANAQYPYQYQPQDRYEQRYGYRYGVEEAQLFDRIRAHLDRASMSPFTNAGDRFRINAARQELTDIENMMSSGQFSRREFNEAIRSLRRVINTNGLRDRNRELLENDLYRLQELRLRSNWR